MPAIDSTTLDVTNRLDLEAFRRSDGTATAMPPGDPRPARRAGYGDCVGVRSSWQIERHCQEDIAFRVLAANQNRDHVTRQVG